MVKRIFIRHDSGVLASPAKIEQLGASLGKIIVSPCVYYGSEEHEAELSSLVREFELITVGTRSIYDYKSLLEAFDESLRNEGDFIFIASLNDIMAILERYGVVSDTNDFDIFTLTWDGSKWGQNLVNIENPENQQDVPEYNYYDPDIPLLENIKFLIRALIYPEIANFQAVLAEIHANIKIKFAEIKYKIQTSLRKISAKNSGQRNKSSNTLNEILNDIYRDIKLINSEVSDKNYRFDEIAKKLDFIPNTFKFCPEDIIKYATEFKDDQLELKECQSSNHSFHELTIINHTDYYWKNLIVFIQVNQDILAEIPILKPGETLYLSLDYQFELLNENGGFSILILNSSHVVSNSTWVFRASVMKLTPNGNNHILCIKSFYIGIKCVLKYRNERDGIEKDIKISLSSFLESKIQLAGLKKGEAYHIKVCSNEGKDLSEEVKLVA
jgi:hypothetical protein